MPVTYHEFVSSPPPIIPSSFFPFHVEESRATSRPTGDDTRSLTHDLLRDSSGIVQRPVSASDATEFHAKQKRFVEHLDRPDSFLRVIMDAGVVLEQAIIDDHLALNRPGGEATGRLASRLSLAARASQINECLLDYSRASADAEDSGRIAASRQLRNDPSFD